MQGLADEALRYHDGIAPAELSWTLVEATGAVLPELHPDLGRWTVDDAGRLRATEYLTVAGLKARSRPATARRCPT
ncbi:hypothetical protein [Nonomuraea sp. NPDC052265]|uniref:hypothetical protein n=1 Tax=Nonomuraea sp. NPDC052265 TaxID=3364374 RepID=UPI0037CCB807